MNQLSRPFHHAYRLLRVYSAIAIGGIFVALLYGLLSAYPQIAIWGVVVIVSGLFFNKIVMKRVDSFIETRRLMNICITKPEISRQISRQEFDRILRRDLTRLLHRPPAFADFILKALLRGEHRFVVLADFHEMYYKNLQEQPTSDLNLLANANFLYWKEVIFSIVPLIIWRLRSGLLDSAMPVELRESARDVLPFYRRKAS